MNNLFKKTKKTNNKCNSRIRQVTCLKKVSKDKLAYEDYQPKEHIPASIEFIDDTQIKDIGMLLFEKV